MTHLLTFGGGLAAGYALAVRTWPAMQAFLAAEIARLKSRVTALCAKAREVLGLRG